MLVFVGSVALNTYLGADARPPKDIDAIADYESALKFLQAKECGSIVPTDNGRKLVGRNGKEIIEIEIAWENTTAASFLELVAKDAKTLDYVNRDECIPSLDWLYTLKMSHRYLRNSPHFLKTRGDILAMRLMGAKIADDNWYKDRMRETYWYELPNLDRDKSEFFVDAYQYDHDSIHEAVAIYDRPAYTYYQHEGLKGVQCSKRMFFDEVSEDIRLAGVVEEATVLSLERSLIPHPGVKTEQQAFDFALMKVCTSITSGWFREYAWENYGAARRLFQQRNKGPLALLEEGLKNGVVKPWQTEQVVSQD